MKFRDFEGEICGGFLLAKLPAYFPAKRTVLQFVTNTSPHSSHQKVTTSKEICHLVLTLGEISRKESYDLASCLHRIVAAIAQHNNDHAGPIENDARLSPTKAPAPSNLFP